MSDRCAFLPYRDAVGATDAGWADVVVPEHATVEEIEAAADAFGAMPGPHRVFLRTRDDPRFAIFARRLAEEHALEENARYGWSYRVTLEGELA